MRKIRIGINGFGRIGRAVLRLSVDHPAVEVVHINDLSPPATLAHMLKYDSVHGVSTQEVAATESGLSFGGREIFCSAGLNPQQIGWERSQVDIVLECTGKFRDRDSAEAHLSQGVKKLIISAPGKESDVTLVMGVNHQDYRPEEHRIISNASCTTNCLAPVVKVLDDYFGIVRGFMTTVHSYTNDQRILCGAHKDLRRGRAAALNQIPTSTGAAKAIDLVMPHLKGKLEGMAIRVPTPNVSLVDLVVEVKKSSDELQVNAALAQAAAEELKGILAYCEEPLVSSDFNGSTYSSTVDALSTRVLEGNMIKVLAWYDNETGFSQRMLELAEYVGRSLEP